MTSGIADRTENKMQLASWTPLVADLARTMNSSFPSAAPSLYAPLPLAQNELARNDSPDSFAPPQLDRHPAKSNGEHAPMSASSKGKGKGRNDRSQSTKREKDDNSDDSSGTTNEKQIRKR